MNKAFNRKGKLPFKQAYPIQYMVACFANSDTSKYAETLNATTIWFSYAKPSFADTRGYNAIGYADTVHLI